MTLYKKRSTKKSVSMAGRLAGFSILAGFLFSFTLLPPTAEASQIKRVQRGTVQFDVDDVTKSVVLPYSVDTTKSILMVTANSQTSTPDQNFFFTVEFEDSSTLNVSRAAGTVYASASWKVVEFEDGVSVQRGVSSMQATGSANKIKDIAIATTGTSTSVPIIQVRAAFTAGTQTEELHLLPSFTSSTNMRLERKDASGTKAISIVWQVIDFLSDVTIQTGTDIIPADNTADDNYVDTTVTAVTNPLLFTYFAGGTSITGLDDAEYTMGEYMSAGPNLRFHRYNNANSAGQQIYVRYYLLDFTDGASTSQTGYLDWAAASSNTLTIAAASTRTIDTQANGGVQNVTPVRIKTTVSHGFATGDVITIAGTGGTALSINTTSGTGIQNSTPIKIRTTTNHTFSTGDTVVLAGTTMPSIAISSWSNTTPIRITTATHNMTTGSYITVASTVATTRTIDTLGNGGITTSGGLVKVKTNASHLYSTGAIVTIAGAGIAAINGTWTITVIDADEFTLNSSASILDSIPVGGGGGGTVNAALTGNYQVTVVSSTQLDLNGTYASGTVATQGTINARLNGSWVITSTAVNEFTLDGTVASGAGNSGTATSNVASLNTTWTITNVDADEFTLDGSTKAGLGGGGTISGANISGINKRNDGQTVRVTTTASHGLSTGSIVDINGATQTYVNGTWPITVVDTTSFLLAGSDSQYVTTNSGGGTVQKPQASSAFTNSIVPSRTIDVISTQAKSVLASATNRGGDDLAIAGWLNTDPANPETATSTYSTIRGVTATALASRTQFYVAELSPVTLKTLNGGEFVAVGSTQTVNWKSAAGVAAHDWKLQMSTDAPHATWTDLTGGTLGTCGAGGNADCTGTDLSTNTVQWKVPDSIGTTVKLRLVDTTDSVAIERRSDQSNANFTIHGSVTVTAPNGGEGWPIGSASSITWTKTGSLDYSSFTLTLSLNSGSSFPNSIATSVVPSALSYAWTPVNADDGTTNRVKIELVADPTHVYDTSNADFAVRGSITVTAPNGAEEWPTQTNQNITWTRTGTFANVKIEYSKNSGGSYPTLIVASTAAAAGTYSWTNIPTSEISTFGRIKITNTADSNVFDVSNADFTVEPSLRVTSPDNGTEIWRTGNLEQVTWILNGSIANVKLEYSKDNFSADNNVIISSTPADPAPVDGNGTYGWTIPDDLSATVKVRVSDAVDAGKFDISDNNFKIRGQITVSAPNGGEVWAVGSSQLIQWTKNGTLGNVDVLYSVNGGSSYPNTLATNQTGTSWTWNPIPDNINSTVRVKVRSVTYNTDTEDESNANFAIKGSFTITSPNGSEQWGAATVHNVTWNYTGTMNNAKLEYSADAGVDGYSSLITNSVAVTDQTYAWTLPSSVGTQYRVKISNNSDSTVYDTSNSNFSIRGSVTLTAPNGGQTWIVGAQENITWTYVGSISNVKLEYSTDGGSNYLAGGLITNSAPVSQAYTWTVADAIGTQLRIRVSDANDSTVNDQSDANFTIKGSLTVTAPNGGESWVVGASQNITWTKTGTIASVKLDYSTNGFTNELENTQIIASTPGGLLSYSWTIPNAISTTLKVRVSNVADTTVKDESNFNFGIKGSVTVTAPNGGESWSVASSNNITWTKTGTLTGNLKLEYSTDAGGSWPVGNLITNTQAASGSSYSWTVPDAPTVQGRVRITQLDDTSVTDTSDGNFSIKGSLTLTAPNGGETWVVGESRSVTWTRVGSIANARLDYSTDGGTLYPNQITASTPAVNQSYSWTIPDSIGTQLRVKVTDANDSTVSDASNANFTVKGSLTIAAPNGGQTWVVGDSQNITWTKTGTIANVKLEYSTNAFATEAETTEIVASTPGADLSYAWTIPDAIDNSIKVRITNLADSSVTDVSDANFAIKGSVTMGSPNGSETWVVGESRNIIWTMTGSIVNVKLEYSTNAFLNETQTTTIVASTAAETNPPSGTGSGQYAWTVADAIGTNLKMRVTDTTNATVTDVSNSAFAVKGSVTLTAPNGGEVWAVAEDRAITWTRLGSFNNVKLTYSTDSGSNYGNVITASTAADPAPVDNAGTFTWTIPDNISTQARVRVANVDDETGVRDESNANFKIRGGLSVSTPNGGEKWTATTSQNIVWSKFGTITSTVKLDYSTDGGSTYPNSIATGLHVTNATPYAWTVPSDTSATARVRVMSEADSDTFDASNANFKIMPKFTISAPNNGEVWSVASSQTIGWTTDGSSPNVKLSYSTDGGVNYSTTIIASTSNTGSYSWTVPDAIGTAVRVKVEQSNDSDAFDTSNANFKIRGVLVVNHPNGGNQWNIGSSQNIQWTRTGSIANVKLEYSTNAFADELSTATIIASTPADPDPADNVGIYAWTIPDVPGVTNRVRVSDASDATAFDTSNANFSIKGSLTLNVPDTNVTWIVATTQNIQWTRSGSIPNVKLEYSENAGSTWPGANVIIASTPADPAPADNIGTYSWTIPDKIGTQLRVRVSDAADASVEDTSSVNFTIRGSVVVTAPNGGETWIVGDSQNITWTSAGSFSNVKLEYSTNAFSNEDNTTVITGSTANDGTHSWSIPDSLGTNLKVRITDTSDANVTDVSNAAFTVKGSVTVTSPNGTEVWRVGESRNITWNRTGTMANVKIEYSTNGGSSYPNTIIASTDATTGSYSWTVPDAIGTQLRVKITNLADTSVNDDSNANFEVKGTVTLTAPNGGQAWTVNSIQNVTWTKTGTFATVKLEYSTNAFASELETTTIAASVDAATGTPYAWTIPDAIDSTVKVRVSNNADSANVVDVSDTTFKIVGSLTLTAPNGGESWAVGSSQTVSWTRVGSIANAKLEYSTNGGTSYPNVIVASTGAGAGAYSWSIPDAIGTNRRVKITDASDSSVSDESNANFTIKGGFAVTAPNGGEVWTVGSAQSITWTTNGSVANVKLEYSTNAFSNESQTTVITASTANTGNSSWTVPDAISSLVRVRVSDVNNSEANDISNASFKIRGALAVTAPNGGEAWLIGNSENIAWTRTGSIANIKIEYSSNAFADELQTTVIIASTPADPAPSDNAGTYSWSIPDNPGTTTKVRVTDASDATVLDTSNSNFSIKGQLILSVPNGGEVWVVATNQNIQWTKYGSISNVKLEYSTDSGSTWPGGNLIVASTAADPPPTDDIGTYSWTIADAIGTTVRVRVSDAADPSTLDTSNANFKIRGSITMTSPNGGEAWIVGSSNNITWTSAGSYSNVKLEYSTNGFSDELENVTITSSTPNDGSFSWTVPDAIDSTVKVRGSDASDSTVNDMSNANFTIKGALELTSPNGTEIWKVGESRSITWNRTGSIANVKLLYSTNGGSAYPNTITNSTSASTGTYSWTVPDSIGTQLRVKVIDVTDATVEDASNANFEVKGSLTLTAPNGSEVWTVASSRNITWTKTGTFSTVKLEYSTNDFTGATTIATGVDAATGTPYAWTVPDVINSTVKVRVSNEADLTGVTDMSDLNFKITGTLTVEEPNGTENWAVGASKTIKWDRIGSIANAKIELSLNGGTSYAEVIVASTGAAAEAYIWTVPDMIGTNRRVKISDVSDSTVFDTSNSNFAIMGAFTVTAPNGGEVWTVNSGQSIGWTTTGTVANVKLEYSKNGFSDETQTTTILASTTNTGSYSWTVADAISNAMKVRVSDAANANAFDVSNAVFKIRGALLLTDPDGGEPWEIGTSQPITWTRTGSIANVKLEYSTNGFSDELQTAVIIASTPADPDPADNNGTYSWTIPDTPGTTNKVRITDATDATVLDTSNANFTIKGRVVLAIPNGGEVWTVSNVQNITWTKFGSIVNVKLQYSADSGGTWPAGNVIVASTAADPAPIDNAGFYSWTIPDSIATTMRVRVQDTIDSSTYDDSNADFKIRGLITLTSPNGGEVWIVGTNQNITWTSAGSYSNVKLEYSTNAFANESNTFSITTATPNDGSFSWSIPDAIGSSVRVRASDAGDSTVVDTSNANFTIKGSISLTSPNGGEVWKVGESRAITWNRAGSFANVKIDYSTNGGSTYPNAVIASTGAGAGTYTWTIPDAIGTQVRVQVADASDSTVSDTSDASFAIKGTVVLVAPNGSEQWAVNTPQNITWTKTGTYATVKLEYSTNAFADELQTTVIATGVDSVTGTPYSWTIPDAIGSSVRVRVTNESDATVTDKSDNNFKIVGSLTLTAPNGGQNWNVGTSQTVSWTRVGSIANVKLEYSTDGGSTYPNLIVASTGAGAGAYSWTVPDSIGTNRRVKITDASDSTVSDTSDANFAIVATFNITAPNGGEVWTVADTQNITWTTTGSVANVKLQYSADNGTDEYANVISNSTPNNLTYSWVIPDRISTLMKVRISDVNNNNGFDTSNAVFKIRGALSVDAPNGGEQWGIGTSQNIQWTRTGSIANVRLQYSSNAFSDETQTGTIIASTPADPAPSDNIGIYAWTIPDNPGTNNKLRVNDVSDATVLDLSNSAFSIKGSLTITAPNGGESWTVGSPYNITWIKGGAISNVKLQYSIDGGSTWPDPSKVITTSTSAGFLSYTWTIPDDINNQGRVRILDTNDSSVNDVSNANFAIRGSLRITSPNGTEIWTVGDTQAITWVKTGTIANVKLDYSTDGGSNYSGSITASTAASAGTYNWVIPDSISTQVRVKITQTNDSVVTDATDANFEIRGSLTITSPNGGEVWRVASSQPITWTKTGTIPTVELKYSTNGGSTYPNSIATGVDGSAGSYSWTIPNAITTNARIKIINEGDTNVFDGSNADFKIAGSITVTAPNGGEKWQIGSSQNITWAITGSINSVKLEYANDGSSYTNEISASVNATSGTPYAWVVPDDPTTQARVKVTNTADATVFDTSNANFKIQGSINLTAPDGGENWNVAESKSITWTRTGSFLNARIEYSTNGGSTYPNTIVASTGAGSLTYAWTIPDNISTTVRVRIQDANDAEVVDSSAANFTIRGVLAVTAPNGGEVWRVGQAQTITWTATGTVNSAKLEYSTNAFTNESQTFQIVASTPVSNLSYAWNIPDSISNTVKVRITDVDGVSLGDTSNGNFAIKGLITLTAPNGGESFGVNSVQNITWSRTGSFANVKLEYSTNAFTNEDNTTLITASTPADPAPVDNNGTYSWTIPDAISTSVKVRVTDANDAATVDTSNNSFTIRGVLTITAPNGGEKWIVGTSQLITWDRQGSISNVKLQYTTNGSIYTDIIASTSNTGTYSWTIPNSVSTTVKVRITDVNNATVTDDSDANFKIQAGFTISTPNGGQVWTVGSSQSIAWSTNGTVATVRLDYSTDSGANYNNQITTSTSNTGSYDWTIPDSVSGTVKVRVSDTSDITANDESNADFRIRATIVVTAPNTAVQWRVGRTQNITWGVVGTIPNVKIQYSRDGFLGDTQTISASASNTGTYAWTIPDSISDTVRVKVSDPNDIGAFDISNADFRITGDFTVTSPNGSEQWNVASAYNITWNRAGSVSNAKLEYSTNAGGSWSPIVGLTPNNGTYSWTVSDSITAQARIQVSDPNDSTASDLSDANFKIKAFFDLDAPNGSEVLTVGDVQNIAWNNTGTVANAKLSYSTDSGATFPNVIAASTANDGSYDWTIPDSISTTVRVRAGSSSDADAFDDSDANFKIRGKFVISAPNGGEAWRIGQNQTVTWTTTGTIANVKIYYSTNGGSTYPNVIIASTANTNSYTWNVPDVPTTTARIRVENTADDTVYDDSNANFRIQGTFTLTAPNGGEAWVVGSARSIAWSWGGTIPNVKLTYSTDGGSSYPNTISASTPNGSGSGGTSSYNWTVPDSISSQVRVKIEDPNDSTVNDVSNADFKITGALAVTSPAGSERWVTNEIHAVTWNTTGTIPNVKLTYSHNDFSTSTTVAASVANTGTYNWTIPDPGVANVPKTTKVRVEDVNDSSVYSNSASFSIDYYYISFDIRDLLTNAAMSDLSVEAYKSTDKTQIIWQQADLTTNPPHVQPMPYGVWTCVFTKTGYGDLKITVNANQDRFFNATMETTVIHLWLADSKVSYNPTTKMLNVQAWLSRDGSLTQGAVSMTWEIGQGATDLGSFALTSTGGGYYSRDIDAGPSGLNLQPGVVYRTLTRAPISTGGEFKTPSSFEITTAKTLQDVKDTVVANLDKPLSQVEAAVSADMATQLAAQKTAIETKLDDTKATLVAKADSLETNVTQKIDSGVLIIEEAIEEFREDATEAVYDINDATAKLAVKVITPDSTKVGSIETLRVSTDPTATVTMEIIAPDGSVIRALSLNNDGTGMFYTSEKFDAQTYRKCIAKAVTFVARVLIPSKNPANPAFETTAIKSMNITSTTLDDVAAAASSGQNAEKAAVAAREAVEDMGKALKGNGNLLESIQKVQESVNRIPQMMKSGEGNAAALKSAIEEVSGKLYAFLGNEGIDFRSVLKQEIGDGMKGVRNKVDRTLAATKIVQEVMERKIGKSEEPIVQSFYEAV